MKSSLRKTSASVSVTYTTGNFSNNLTGSNFTIEAKDDIIKIGIDMSCNLRVKNKEENCFYDANELANDHAILKSVQIDEKQIIDGLIKAEQKYPDAVWELELDIGDKGLFKYTISVLESNESVFLNIEK